MTGDQERHAAALMVRAQSGDRTAYADLLMTLTAHRGYKALRRLLGKRDEERQD